jgi:hypothetical protein
MVTKYPTKTVLFTCNGVNFCAIIITFTSLQCNLSPFVTSKFNLSSSSTFVAYGPGSSCRCKCMGFFTTGTHCNARCLLARLISWVDRLKLVLGDFIQCWPYVPYLVLYYFSYYWATFCSLCINRSGNLALLFCISVPGFIKTVIANVFGD